MESNKVERDDRILELEALNVAFVVRTKLSCFLLKDGHEYDQI